jgi:FMN-dependent NADH-azoreductase
MTRVPSMLTHVMSYLLSVTASTRGEESWSNKVLAEFEREFIASHPGAEIKRRFAGDVPHLDFAAQKAGRIPAERQSPEDVAAFALAHELTEELIAASALVIATPMYNWGPPSSLKAWIDRIVNIKTFYQQTGALADLPVTVIIASGGLYSEGENMKHDFLRPLLDEVFTRIGVQDITFVNCDPAGPLDRVPGALDAPGNAYAKALAQVPAAAARIR